MMMVVVVMSDDDDDEEGAFLDRFLWTLARAPEASLKLAVGLRAGGNRRGGRERGERGVRKESLVFVCLFVCFCFQN